MPEHSVVCSGRRGVLLRASLPRVEACAPAHAACLRLSARRTAEDRAGTADKVLFHRVPGMSATIFGLHACRVSEDARSCGGILFLLGCGVLHGCTQSMFWHMHLLLQRLRRDGGLCKCNMRCSCEAQRRPSVLESWAGPCLLVASLQAFLCLWSLQELGPIGRLSGTRNGQGLKRIETHT